MANVELWVYNLGNESTLKLLNAMLGIELEGIWHTSLVVFNEEHYFMGGIRKSAPGTTPFGSPAKKIDFGSTEITNAQLDAFLSEIDELYTEKTYHIIRNNCNHFSNSLLKHLVNKEMPAYIMEVAKMFENTPFESMLTGLAPGMP
ncbi:desumoylating isopeptidase 1 [Nematocida minor]|uniref:desumoylating isopeptidase 1 n=1 Tax=Nematocida minor TaxID=1912983 RepID=UPI00221ED758|nr:desumoylating isopeptidase 1 [Nematocida minor]KAI5191231.1 desumoylating isopeptidase 1 [Nematocida minor]